MTTYLEATGYPVAQSSSEARALFIRRTYTHLAGGAILYDTSNIIHKFSTDQHVAAALQLFASIALLFWYVLRIMIALSRD